MCITVKLILRAHKPTQTYIYGRYFKYRPIFVYLHLFIYMWTNFSLVDGGHQEMYQSKITVTYVETDSKTLFTLIIIAIGIQLSYDHMYQR